MQKRNYLIVTVFLTILASLFVQKAEAGCFAATGSLCGYVAKLCSDGKTCCTSDAVCPGTGKPPVVTPYVGASGCYTPTGNSCGLGARLCPGTTICCASQVTCPKSGSTLNSLPSDGTLSNGGSPGNSTKKVCDFISDGTQKGKCQACFDGTPPGSWTAIGCIKTDPTEFIKSFLTFGIGIAGGIAFLLILLGGFQILTSAGNPEQLNAGRELVGAAVSGLLMIIFSLFLLRAIGADILGIPGFG